MIPNRFYDSYMGWYCRWQDKICATNAEWKAIEDRRKTTTGVRVLLSEEKDLAWTDWDRQKEIEKLLTETKLRHKLLLIPFIIHIFFSNHGFTHQYRKMKAFWQRGKYGIADRDVWELHMHMANVMVRGLTKLRDCGYGMPTDQTQPEWRATLTEIIDGFGAFYKLQDILYFDDQKDEKREQAQAQFEKGMSLLTTHYLDLWD